MTKFPESRRIFQRGGRFYEMGEVLRQPDLQRTLERIAKHGADDFYAGETARLIAADMKKNNGTIILDDLKQYRPVERKPLMAVIADTRSSRRHRPVPAAWASSRC